MLRNVGRLLSIGLVLALLSSCAGQPTSSPAPISLTELAAGTLAVPFTTLNATFEHAQPGATVQAQFGGSVKMAKQITQLHQPADLLAVADYSVIPNQLFQHDGTAHASWYIGFAANAITFVYTDKSKGADRITAANWYQVLAQPGIQIGRSNPDTDPSGYQTLQMLTLAERYYHQPGLAQAILKNAPPRNMRDTETALIGALETGQIDYLVICRSDAIHFKYLELPPQINLSNASLAADYATVSVSTHNGQLTAKPIIYAITIPANAPHPQPATAFIQLLLSPQGRSVLQQDGFTLLDAPIAHGSANLPAALKPLVKPWPGEP